MSAKILIAGLVVGLAAVGALGYISMHPTVNAEKVCADRFGGNWTGEQVQSDLGNQSVTLECTNGTVTETIGVSVDVEVTADA